MFSRRNRLEISLVQLFDLTDFVQDPPLFLAIHFIPIYGVRVTLYSLCSQWMDGGFFFLFSFFLLSFSFLLYPRETWMKKKRQVCCNLSLREQTGYRKIWLFASSFWRFCWSMNDGFCSACPCSSCSCGCGQSPARGCSVWA